MKKFTIAVVAASMLAGPVLAAPGHDQGRNRYEQNQRQEIREDRREIRQDRRELRQDRRAYVQQQRHWNRGERFDYRQARNYRVISSPYQYRLNDAPRGYRWVQSGDDAVLIGLASGVVAAVLAGAIH
jgi:Ni/Co efflux regulator RcnB